MSGLINPRDRALNYVTVLGIDSPGRATITGAAIPYVWEITPGYGMSGARTVFKGRGVAKFTLTIDLWELEHFIAWPIFCKTLEPPKPGLKLVCEMKHPILSAQGIKAVAVESFGALEKQSNGLWRSTSQLLEYRPPLPAIVKPIGSVPGVEKGKPIPPKTEADIALAAETARLASLRAQ